MSEKQAVQEPRVAIIGGGLAGVATCKALTCRGIPCTLFERQPRVGGLWVDNYPGACVQAPPKQYEYPDAAIPTPADSCHSSAAEVTAYCEAYVRKWKLEEHLRLGMSVEGATQQPGGGFIVETRPVADSGAEVAQEEFTHVVVCAGMFSSVGNTPDFPGLSGFDGLLLHSSERRDDAAELSGRRVMVIGAGKSAQDAAVAAVRAGAATVTLAMRQPHLMVPLKLFGVIPYQWAFTNLMVQKILPVYPGRRPLSVLGRAARAVTAPVRGLVWGSLKAIMLLHYRLPMRLWPRGSLEREMMGVRGPSIYTKEFIRGARRGAIDVQVAEVANIGRKSVTLRTPGSGAKSNKEFPVDTLILATGFEGGYPFLSDGMREALNQQPDGLPLYRHIVPPDLPGLFFVGRAVSFSAPLTVSVQAAWVGELLQGRLQLPAAEVMHAETERWSDAMSSSKLSSSRRHLVSVQGERYAQELLRDIGTRHLALYGGPFGPIANAVMPQNPENFGNAVQPPGVRKNRRLKPPLWLKAVVVAAVAGGVRAVHGSWPDVRPAVAQGKKWLRRAAAGSPGTP